METFVSDSLKKYTNEKKNVKRTNQIASDCYFLFSLFERERENEKTGKSHSTKSD